jgi:glutamyl-Q tRNA(Asp) synthetase
VRMEDLDAPRCVPGAADDILRTLEIFGLRSDEPIIYQSQRTAAYEEALHQLQASGAVYPCCCTRKEISDSALLGIEGPVYPGTCRNGVPAGRDGRAWRVRTDISPVRPEPVEGRMGHFGKPRTGFDKLSQNASSIEFEDALQGHISQHLESRIGDFVVKRADDLFAYQLAVVVDDAFQNITHIVRGADLLASTPRQIYLQRLLGLPTPHYMHLPIAVNDEGEKLSKQTLAAPVDASRPVTTLLRILDLLQQEPPAEFARGDVKSVLEWAVENWHAAKLRGIRTLLAHARNA